jgi:hypothetical protein
MFRELARTVRAALVSWPHTFRLCLIMLVIGLVVIHAL